MTYVERMLRDCRNLRTNMLRAPGHYSIPVPLLEKIINHLERETETSVNTENTH